MQLVRDVLKRIDLDPASSAAANLVVLAVRFFTIVQNGLLRRWRARALWMNPPYSKPAPWSRKLLEAYNAGDVHEAIALFNSDTGAKWFHPLAAQAWRCEPFKRIKFWGPSTTGTTGFHPSTFFYLGRNPERFAAVFSKIGRIVPPAHVTKGVTTGRTCIVCTRLLVGLRTDADTCSSRCRQRRYRMRTANVVLEAPSSRPRRGGVCGRCGGTDHAGVHCGTCGAPVYGEPPACQKCGASFGELQAAAG
jgi:predicted nucleic acid-binding Zn ribbon protein